MKVVTFSKSLIWNEDSCAAVNIKSLASVKVHYNTNQLSVNFSIDYRVRYFCPVGSLPDLAAKRRVQQEKIDRGDAKWTPYFTVDEPTEYGDVEYLAVGS